MTKNTIRFWEFVNGSPVRFQLSVGSPIEYVRYRPDSEGYSKEWYRYEYDGESVLSEMHGEGRDCDGFHMWGGKIAWDCKTMVEIEGIMMPKWNSEDDYRRDLTAEENNY